MPRTPTCPLPTLPSFPLPSYLPSNHACSLVNPTTASTPITNARRPFHHSARFTDRLLQISSRHSTLSRPPSPPPPRPSTANRTHRRIGGGDSIYTPSLFLLFSFTRFARRLKSSPSSSFLPNIRFRPRFSPNPLDTNARTFTIGHLARYFRGFLAGHASLNRV